MLPQKRRVSRRVFNEGFKASRIVSTDYLTLRFFKASHKDPSKISVAVSKKVSLSAVKRNQIKRRINSIIEKKQNELLPSYVLIIFPKKGAQDLPFSVLKEEVASSFMKIGVLRG